MKTDGARIPGECIIVVVQAVPPGVERRPVAAQWCGRRAELGSRVVLDDFQSGSHVKFPTMMDIPISGGGAMVRKAFDGSVLQVETTLPREAVCFRVERLIDQSEEHTSELQSLRH